MGYDVVDVAAATRHKIAVTITPGTNEDSVAEQALALIFGVFRKVPLRDRDVRGGAFRRSVGGRLMGKTLGLVGLGRIGRALAWRAIGLGLNVIACDPCADAAYCDEHRISLCDLEKLLATADIVSLHLPGTAETKHIINARTLALMKPTAVLINTARGLLVDEAALVEALSRGTIAAAGLDVFEREPLPGDSAISETCPTSSSAPTSPAGTTSRSPAWRRSRRNASSISSKAAGPKAASSTTSCAPAGGGSCSVAGTLRVPL